MEEAIKQRFWLGSDETEKTRSRKQEQSVKNSGEPVDQPSQPTVTECNFTKKQDDPPSAKEGE